MALIKDRRLALDTWQRLDADAELTPSSQSHTDLIVPLALWRTQRDSLTAREGRLGVWLRGSDEPAAIVGDFEHFAVIAVEFSSFTDGRGYSIGRLLRDRYGWRGELRAFGDVQRDQLLYLMRCGFDAFVLRDGEDTDVALRAFTDFTDAYQASWDRPVPLFRRRSAAAA